MARIRKLLLALEDNGPDGDAPLDPIDETPDSSDTPAAAAADNDAAPAEGDAPAASADGDAPAEGGDTPADGEDKKDDKPEGEDEISDDQDEPIRLHDTDDLQVDKLDELTAKADFQDEKRSDERATLDNSLDDLTVLTTAYESLRAAMESGTPQPEAVALANRVLHDVNSRVFQDSEIQVAVEGFGDLSSVSLEGFRSTMKALFRAIIDAIIRAVEWIKKRFKDFFEENRWVLDSTRRLTKDVVDFRHANDKKFSEAFKARRINEAAYVQGPTFKAFLTYLGKQPGAGMTVVDYDADGRSEGERQPSYAEAFSDLHDLLKLQDFFSSLHVTRFAADTAQVVLAIDDGEDYPVSMMGFNPRLTVPNGARPMFHFEGYTCPEDAVLYVREGYLGSMALGVQVAHQPAPTNPREAIQQASLWKMDFHKEPVEMISGTLRFLATNEIVDGSKMSQEISEELLRLRKTVDIVDQYSQQLKKLMVSIEARFAGDVMVDGNEQSIQYIELSHAINAVVRNASTFLVDGAPAYCRLVQYAWLKYLLAIQAQDKLTVAGA